MPSPHPDRCGCLAQAITGANGTAPRCAHGRHWMRPAAIGVLHRDPSVSN
jgi:hypothetical protein